MANQFFQNPKYQGLTVGIVVDTNDPQQTGRLRIMVPTYGDRHDTAVADVPWAMYVSPFGGTVNNDSLKRGTEQQGSAGPVAYGFWNIPKLGSTAIVTCIDGNPMARLWIGCLHTERLNHTLPHGRYVINGDGEPDGPLNSSEERIQPLYQNQGAAFGPKSQNYEWRTRGADFSATATADNFYVEDGVSSIPDDKDVNFTAGDGKTTSIRQGYALSQIEPDLRTSSTNKNYDSQVYSWTTPGFHSISMDDRQENCRVKIRTTSGHQVILDDTNERIYINTCEGRNWIELDQDGNIDIYATTKVNIRTEGDINLTADKSIRMHAGEAIHMYSKKMNIQTTEDYHVKVGASAKIHSTGNMSLQTDASLHLLVGSEGMITTGGTLHLKAGGQILGQGSQVYMNGPSPTSASPAGEDRAKFTNRVPSHEPWARMTTKDDYSHEPKYDYDNPAVGSEDKARGKNWRR